MKLHQVITAFVTLAGAAVAATHHVPGQFPTVQAAIDAAGGGDTVLVAPGTYPESIDFKGKALAVRATGGPEVTVLRGGGYAVPPAVVTFATGEGPGSVIEGFTITDGWGYDGGGIHCTQSSPTIRGNRIAGNYAGDFNSTGRGAGIFSTLGAPLIEGNVIEGNIAGSHYGGEYGGGVYCDAGNPVVRQNVIRENHANTGGGVYLHGPGEILANLIEANQANFGGGVACISSTARIADNRILDNRLPPSLAFGSGGGIYVDSGAPTIDGNVIRGNRTFGSGGGIHCNANSSPFIVNDTIVFNSTDLFGPSRGGGLFVGHGCVVGVANTLLWGNTAQLNADQAYVAHNPYPATLQIHYSDVQGGAAMVGVEPGSSLFWGTGNIDVDPNLEDDHLRHTSPCVNAGNVADVQSTTDFEGDPRVAFGSVDIGADEFHLHLYHTGDATPGGAVTVKVIGGPGTNPVTLFVGAGVLGAPIPTVAGPFFLAAPLFVIAPLGPVSSDGVVSFTATIPTTVSTPVDVALQALVGSTLTNVDLVEIR